MFEWDDSQKKPNSNFRVLLQEIINKSNPRREFTADESKSLTKLEKLAEKLKREENV